MNQPNPICYTFLLFLVYPILYFLRYMMDLVENIKCDPQLVHFHFIIRSIPKTKLSKDINGCGIGVGWIVVVWWKGGGGDGRVGVGY